jgi:hypothetical protein
VSGNSAERLDCGVDFLLLLLPVFEAGVKKALEWVVLEFVGIAERRRRTEASWRVLLRLRFHRLSTKSSQRTAATAKLEEEPPERWVRRWKVCEPRQGPAVREHHD